MGREWPAVGKTNVLECKLAKKGLTRFVTVSH